MVSEEVESDIRILSLALSVLTINDLGLGGVHLQSALSEPGLQLGQQGLRVLLGSTVHETIVGVPAPREVVVRPVHPCIEAIVQEQIRENWANYSPYAKGNFCFERVISGWRGALTVLDLRLKK